MNEIEVWIVMDEDGNYEVGTDRSNAIENFENNIDGAAGARIVQLAVKMAPPKKIVVDVTVPDEVGDMVEAEPA